MRYLVLLTLALLFAATHAAHPVGAAGFVVNSTGDGADLSIDGVCDAGGGACTLRAAIEEGNATPALDEITFNIPGAGVHVISPGNDFVFSLPDVTQPISIDATTQPGYAGEPLVQLDGANAPGASGLTIAGGNSVVRGLSITGFQQWGIDILSTGGNTIQANYIGLEPDGVTANGNGLGGGGGIYIYEAVQGGNIVGGTLPGQRNVISGNNGYGIWVAFGYGSNVISGNFIGTDSTGTEPVGNDDAGIVLIQNNGNVIGGTARGAGNVISDNWGGAIYVAFSQDNTIQGNLIGTDVSGSSALGNGYWGISLQNANANVIGGNIPAARNVISANSGGILLAESSHSNTIQGNYIGTDHSGLLPLGNASAGILAFRSSIPDGAGNTIGGSGPNEGNLITYNGFAPVLSNTGAGVSIGYGAQEYAIRGNSIHDNGALGIDYDDEIWTAAPPPPPTITGVGSVTGTSLPDCTIDVYSDAADEGGVYYGSTTADGAGNWTYSGAVGGPNLTATCTDAAGSTSEFSAPFPSGCAPTDTDCDGVLDASDNCPSMPNPSQGDIDADGFGDACDSGPSGDVDCSGTANSVDALKVLRYTAGLLVGQNHPCVLIGNPQISGWQQGDVNCSGGANSVDALLILRAITGLGVSLPAGCPPIKEPSA